MIALHQFQRHRGPSKLIDVTAELEARKVQLAAIEAEEEARAKIEKLKSEQTRDLETQESELKSDSNEGS